MASPSIDDLLAAIRAVADLQKDMVTLQESVAKHAKVLERLADAFQSLDARLSKQEGRK